MNCKVSFLINNLIIQILSSINLNKQYFIEKSFIMTLNLFVKSISNAYGLGSGEIILIADGGQAGQLRSQKISGNRWDPPFQITMADTDNVLIQAYKSANTNQDNLYGEKLFRAQIYVKNNADNLSPSEPFSDQIDLPNEDDERQVNLQVEILYDKTRKYQGELNGKSRLNMNPPTKQNIRFYKGKCETYNLFSMLDEGNEQQSFKAVESIYRDK